MKGDTIGQMLNETAERAATQVRTGEVVSVGNGTCDVLLDGGTSRVQNVTTSVVVRRRQRVQVQKVGGSYNVVGIIGG